MLGIKQDALAFDLNMSQQAVSQIEQKETIDAALLQQIADILKLPVEAIQNFDEEQAVNVIANTFSLDNGSIFNAHNTNPVFNPVEAVLKLHEEKIALYERMLKEKDEMMAELKNLINK
ncbi:helix-turn-helix domain-containing protein [Niabella hibiscisoli]|nr:helix-turn-helix domain-containing protein [Niabella hibiscisoli]